MVFFFFFFFFTDATYFYESGEELKGERERAFEKALADHGREREEGPSVFWPLFVLSSRTRTGKEFKGRARDY